MKGVRDRRMPGMSSGLSACDDIAGCCIGMPIPPIAGPPIGICPACGIICVGPNGEGEPPGPPAKP